MKQDEITCACGMPVKRKAARRILKKCIRCGTDTCGYCRIMGYCIDCYVKMIAKDSAISYFKEKYRVVA